MDGILKFLGQVAPTIATALGGPVAGLAVKAIGEAIGLPDGSKDEVIQAVANATPEQLLAIKAADQAFSVRMRELDIDLDRLSVENTRGAREMRIATGSRSTDVLAGIILLGFFGILGWMIAYGLPKDVGGSEAMLILLGALSAAFGAVVNFFFGSSASSRVKDATIHAATQK